MVKIYDLYFGYKASKLRLDYLNILHPTYVMKTDNRNKFDMLKLGVMIYIGNIDFDMLDFKIFRKELHKTKRMVLDLLGFTRTDMLTKESIKVPSGNKDLIEIKFKTKYFAILGAIATIAGYDTDNVQEEMKDLDTVKAIPTFDNDELPKLKEWAGVSFKRSVKKEA